MEKLFARKLGDLIRVRTGTPDRLGKATAIRRACTQVRRGSRTDEAAEQRGRALEAVEESTSPGANGGQTDVCPFTASRNFSLPAKIHGPLD